MARLIDVDEAIVNFGFEWDDIPPTREEFVAFLKKQKVVGEEVVEHGYWGIKATAWHKHTAEGVRRMLGIYVHANCSNCGRVAPRGSGFSRTLYAPDGEEQTYEWDLDEEEKKAIEEFKRETHRFSKYCQNCGSFMEGWVAE